MLVTGARTGIGSATAERLLEEGARVVATARDAASLPESGAENLALDVTSSDSWTAVIAATLERFGCLDGLVNNAGVRESGTVEATSDALWRQMIDTNLSSVFFGCRAVAPHLAEGGAIVNVGSITGIRGTEN
ncbi:MAG: SDR family NAD(P)-dependent oxidoreductase, partial [Pseudomonadota bacterium]